MLERNDMDKHSSLSQKFVNYGHKKFITLGSGGRNWYPVYPNWIKVKKLMGLFSIARELIHNTSK
jgi:hypothetical protein